ncbi:sensor histidine kinase [Undibacterium fentianense]|uniref:histidine kinase n=1 Tax=Undibacterium fentianense TaxID=2828728 RepID=A0A941E5D7_9BURK|nr:PAS domain-containing sensor histidine kinase [Undibacterium fentianense]MBR7799073.1 PAS domain-containing sensor histidine kinase [Undibacterium fentianense]
MQTELPSGNELTIQESKDRIQINEAGVKLLMGIGVVAFFICLIALIANVYFGKGVGSSGAMAGLVVAAIIVFLVRYRRLKLALSLILWGFALIPIVFGFRTFGFNAPGIICLPISIMAASWALSVRHAIAMTFCACLACIAYYFLITYGVIVPVQPELLPRLTILVGVTIIALLLGLVGVRALRLEFARVRELADSLQRNTQELERSEASFSALFLSNPLPSISGDIDGRLIDVNHAFVSSFGYSREQLIRQSVGDLGLFVEDRERRSIAKRTLETGVVGYPVMLRLANGEIRHFLISTAAFELSGGWRFVASFLDQTDRLAAEQVQQNLNAELEQRVAVRTQELSEALQSLQRTQGELVQSEKLASLGSMVAGIAHELNTPVGNALMVSSALVDQQVQFETGLESGLSRSALNHFLMSVRDSSDILSRNLRRTADLINSFKQVAVDQTSEQRRHFALHDVIHEVIVTQSPTLKKTTHRVLNEVPEGILMDSFPGPLEQVLMNLMNNALRHAFEGRVNGIMRLGAELLDDEWVRIRFSDNGIGISEQHLQKIFDPFFTTKLGQGGSGLGLSIAYNIVTAMLGGRIEVRSQLGQGTEFVIEIPLTASAELAVDT